LGGALRRHEKFQEKRKKFDSGAYIQFCSHLFYQKFLRKTIAPPRFCGAGQKTQKSLGRGGKKKGCGENEFPPRPRSHRRRNFLASKFAFGSLLFFVFLGIIEITIEYAA